MKKIIFLLFVILSLDCLSTVTYYSIGRLPWFYDISIEGHDYGPTVTELRSGEVVDMTLLTPRIDHEVTVCTLEVWFKSCVTPYNVITTWSFDENVFSPSGYDIRIHVYDVIGASERWPLGWVTMEIYLRDQNSEVLAAGKLELLIL